MYEQSFRGLHSHHMTPYNGPKRRLFTENWINWLLSETQGDRSFVLVVCARAFKLERHPSEHQFNPMPNCWTHLSSPLRQTILIQFGRKFTRFQLVPHHISQLRSEWRTDWLTKIPYKGISFSSVLLMGSIKYSFFDVRLQNFRCFNILLADVVAFRERIPPPLLNAEY